MKNKTLWLLAGCALLLLLAGASNGVHETIHYHYSQFKAKCPGVNDLYWNPEVSWRNKYKGGDPNLGPKFPGSTTIFATFTDAKHLFGTLTRWLMIFGCCFAAHFARPAKWQGWAILFGAIFICISAGFTVIYSVIF